MENELILVGPSYKAWERVIAWILPVGVLVLAVYGGYLHGWKMFLAVFPFGLLLLAGAVYWIKFRETMATAKILINPESEEIRFQNFQFSTQFLPQKAVEEEILGFSELLAGKLWIGQGRSSYHLRTLKGKVVIPEEISGFKDLVELLDKIIASNCANVKLHEKNLEREPKIKTKWYGWVVIVAALVTVGVAGWYFIFQT